MATMSRICKVCKRRFSIPARTRPRNTCSHECLNELLSLHVNASRNKSGQFVCEDESGRQPHDPTPEQIAAMKLEIKTRNLEKLRLLR
ncbi:MAG: hypothetical protein IPH59_11815 [bacterium]|nr:hypothetical protein [bacterium]